MLVLTISADEKDVTEAIVAGACGYLLKESGMSELVAGVRAAAAGEAAITPRIAAGLLGIVRERLGEMPAEGREATLSSRELEVLRLVAQGRENSEIAAELVISLPTVKHQHLQHPDEAPGGEPHPGCGLCGALPPRLDGLAGEGVFEGRQAVAQLDELFALGADAWRQAPQPPRGLRFMGVRRQRGHLAFESPQLVLEPQRVGIALGEDALGAGTRRARLEGFQEPVDSSEKGSCADDGPTSSS